MVVVPLAGVKVPGPLRLQLMVAVELASVAVKRLAPVPATTVSEVGLMVRVGTGLMVIVALAVTLPAVAVSVAVVCDVTLAGGV